MKRLTLFKPSKDDFSCLIAVAVLVARENSRRAAMRMARNILAAYVITNEGSLLS
jgi:hypothetical protein